MRTLEPGFYPFWFWNADLDEGEIRRQIGEMAAQGIKGFFIHSRQGLEVPYLSESFFRLVAAAIDEARKRGLVANLYDEYPYPSGVAGGEVVLGAPGFQATALVHERHERAGGRVRLALPIGQVLCCIACPVRDGQTDWGAAIDCREAVGMVLAEQSYVETGLTAYNRKRFFASSPTPTLEVTLPEGNWLICACCQVLVTHHKYWGAYVDALNERAIARFIELTHERYARRFAAEMGETIRAIFVDETAPSWTPDLPRLFLERYRYDLLPLLPALEAEDHSRHVQVTADFERLRHELFCRSFDEPLAAWCREHGIAWLGEKPSYRLSELRYMDVPGCDVGHTKAGAPTDVLRSRLRANSRATASAAYFYGKPRALCECFHSLGWGATMQDARLIVDELLLQGIDVLVPHAFFYSTHALQKHDAPPSFFFQTPWWKLWHLLSRRVDTITGAFAGTRIDAAVLVVDPGPGIPTAQGKEVYERLMAELMRAHVDFAVTDTDVLQAWRAEAGKIMVKDLAAAAVLVPPMRYVEAELESCLRGLEQAGGRVIRVGAEPDWAALTAAVTAAAQPRLTLRAVEGDASRVRVVSRTDGRRRVMFLLNPSPEAVTLALQADGELAELPLEADVPAFLERTGAGYTRRLGPFEAALLENGGPGARRSGGGPPARVELRLEGPATVRLLGRNLLRMARWSLTLRGGRAGGAALSGPALVAAAPIANQIAEGRLAFAPEIRTFFGHEPELLMPELTAVYAFDFENRYEGPVELVMEPGSIRGDARVRVNDCRPRAPDDFRPTDAHVRGSLGLDVTRDLAAGRNRVTVEVVTDRPDGGLVNPLYLAGDFGVGLEPLALRPRSADGRLEDYTGNSAPFYSGTVEYRMQATLRGAPRDGSALLELALPPHFEEACEVSLNEHPFRPAPWSPYRILVPAAEIRNGANDVRVRVHTTLARAFDGTRFDAGAHRYVPV